MSAAVAVRTEVEKRIVALLTDRLGVDRGIVTPEVSLADDLAADSLDLAEIALAIEDEFDVVFPRRVLDFVRTCGELVDVTVVLTRRRPAARGSERPLVAHTRIVEHATVLERVLALTPYAVETLVEDALRAGAGARLEVTVAAETDPRTVASLAERLSVLGPRGVAVAVRRSRDERWPGTCYAA